MAIAPAAIPSFHAQWNDTNRQFLKMEPTLAQKVWRVVWNIISIIIPIIAIARLIGWVCGAIAKKFVLPSAWFYPFQIQRRIIKAFNAGCFGPIREYNESFRNQYEVQRHHIFTPDGVRLNAYYFKHRLANENTDTLLFSQSNASFTEQGVYSWLIEKAVERNSLCNFVVFDYRGVSLSRGDIKRTNDLLIDQESMVQFVRDNLHVPPQKLRWYGWSIGGGVSGTVKAKLPEFTGRYVSERSFKSIEEVIKHQIIKWLWPLWPLLFWIPCTVRSQGFGLEVPLEEIQGESLFVVHKIDPTIPYPASAHQAMLKTNRVFQSIELYQTPEQIEEAEDRNVDHHFEPLAHYMANPGQTADDAIADFILPPAAAQIEAIA